MKLFNLVFDAPIYRFDGRITNAGTDIPEKSGILTFRAFDEQDHELPSRSIGLPTSSHLDVGFMYVPPTHSRGQIKLPSLTSTRPVARMEIGYEPLFAKVPVTARHIGVMSYSVEDNKNPSAGIVRIDFGWPVDE